MKGAKFVILRDVADFEPGQEVTAPVLTPNSILVAALTAFGCSLHKDHPPEETREAIRPVGGGRPKIRRTVTWVLNPISDDGKTCTNTLARKAMDPAWRAANADHPVAFVLMGFHNHARLIDHVQKGIPYALVRAGMRTAKIPANATPEERKRLQDLLNEAPAA